MTPVFRGSSRAFGVVLLGLAGACGGRTSLATWSDDAATEGAGGLAAVGGSGGTQTATGGGGAPVGGSGGVGVPAGGSGGVGVPVGGSGGVGVNPVRQFGTEAVDFAWDVVVDAAGYVYVSGTTYGSLAEANVGEGDAYVRRYSPAGNVEWTVQLGVAYYDDATELELGPDGEIYVRIDRINPTATTTAFVILDPTGSVVQMHEQPAFSTSFAVDAQGNVVSCELDDADGNFDIVLSKHQPDGVPIWSVPVQTPASDYPSAVTMLEGDVILAGSTSGDLFRTNLSSQEPFVARFSVDGDLVWGLQFDAAGWIDPAEVVVDGAGDLYVVGSGSSTSGSDGFVAKVSGDGELSWASRYGGRYWADDYFVDAVIDGQGLLSVVGRTNGAFGESHHGLEDGFVARIHPDGGIGPVRQFGTAADEYVGGVARAPDDALFVAGATAQALGNGESSGGIDAFLLRVDGDL